MSLSLTADLSALLLAHEGGWDEIGLVAIPLVIVAALLVLANRRAKRLLADHQTDQTDHAHQTGQTDQTDQVRPENPGR